VTALFALASAVLVGGADFVGGFASRRASPPAVAAASQLIGLALAIPLALLWQWEHVTNRDAVLSVAGGLSVGVGLALFYTAMSIGLISLVAPIAAVTGAALPACIGLVRGDDTRPLALFGIVLALVAVAAVSVAPGTSAQTPRSTGFRVILLAIAAGGLFGVFFLLFSATDADSGMWPVALERIGSSAALVVVVLALRAPVREMQGVAGISTLIAALEVSATVPLLLALQRGPLPVASVLASLYPVTTVLLAAGLLHERLSRPQMAGVALALTAVVLVSTGS
jgi:drug/metabolite transporter (DMT)-like permease